MYKSFVYVEIKGLELKTIQIVYGSSPLIKSTKFECDHPLRS